MKKAMSVLSLVGVLCSAPAAGVVIDFNSAPPGCYSAYTDQGVTFTASDGLGLTSFNFASSPNGTPGVIGCFVTGSFASTIATFASTYTGSVSVDLGDFNEDAETVFLELYDAANNLLAQASQLLAADFIGMVTLAASAANVAYAVFGGSGELGSSVYGDNFTFAPQVIPEPAPLAMIALGLVLLAARRRR